MHKGYLISFEGKDASGKSELLYQVNKSLKCLGYKTKIVEEFSKSEIGNYIRKLLSKDKFLRFGYSMSTALTETMYVITDLYYQDEIEIKPALEKGKIVLKERHIDTLFACQIPKIMDDYKKSRYDELHQWIRDTTSNLYTPDLTFLLTIPIGVMKARLKDREEPVSDGDLKVFEEREKIYEQLTREHKERIDVFDNDRSIEEATNKITERIVSLVK